MARYRIHQFDIDGRVVATDIIHCVDDQAAMRALVVVDDPVYAVDKLPTHAMEIWLGDRCIKRTTDARFVRHSGPMIWPRLS